MEDIMLSKEFIEKLALILFNEEPRSPDDEITSGFPQKHFDDRFHRRIEP